MPKTRQFFSAEMGSRLREIRGSAGLTQDQVAARLGLVGKKRSSYVVRLEKGMVKRPYLDTVVRFVHVCGVRVDAITDLLDRVEHLPEDPAEREIVSQLWSSHAAPALPGQIVMSEEAKRRVIQESEQDAAKYQRHLAYPHKGAPPPPEQLQAGTGKLRDYYYQLKTIRTDIRNYLGIPRVPVRDPLVTYTWCELLGSKFLAAFRKCKGPKLSAKLDEVTLWARASGYEPEIIPEIREVVETRWYMTFQPRSPSEIPSLEVRRREMELESAFLGLDLYDTAYRVVYPLLDEQQRLRGADYCELASRFYRVWIQVLLTPKSGRAALLKLEFDTLAEQAIARGLVPAAVKAVRESCGRLLTV